MKTVLTVLMAALLLVQFPRFTHAEQRDNPECYKVCDTSAEKCSADVINLPEPRTVDEQQKLDECSQMQSKCTRDCDDSAPPPAAEPPKQEEENK